MNKHLVYPIMFGVWICAKCGRKLNDQQIQEECDHTIGGSLIEKKEDDQVHLQRWASGFNPYWGVGIAGLRRPCKAKRAVRVCYAPQTVFGDADRVQEEPYHAPLV